MISLKFVLKGQINNIPVLVQVMAWRRSGDKPLSEQMMVSLLTHLCHPALMSLSVWCYNGTEFYTIAPDCLVPPQTISPLAMRISLGAYQGTQQARPT